jgi:hypothetical protein
MSEPKLPLTRRQKRRAIKRQINKNRKIDWQVTQAEKLFASSQEGLAIDTTISGRRFSVQFMLHPKCSASECFRGVNYPAFQQKSKKCQEAFDEFLGKKEIKFSPKQSAGRLFEKQKWNFKRGAQRQLKLWEQQLHNQLSARQMRPKRHSIR